MKDLYKRATMSASNMKGAARALLRSRSGEGYVDTAGAPVRA